MDSITLDPNWAKILDLDPDQNSMYLDPQHWHLVPKADLVISINNL